MAAHDLLLWTSECRRSPSEWCRHRRLRRRHSAELHDQCDLAGSRHRCSHAHGRRSGSHHLTLRRTPEMPTRKHFVQPQRRAQSGVTLIELMVALAIGAFLMIGAITVFMQSRTTFRVTESLSRLQENGRFALDALEPDIRMARYWGLTTRTEQDREPREADGSEWHRRRYLRPELAHRPRPRGRWVRTTRMGSPRARCSASFQPNTDTLVVRRAMEDTVAAAALAVNTMYLADGALARRAHLQRRRVAGGIYGDQQRDPSAGRQRLLRRPSLEPFPADEHRSVAANEDVASQRHHPRSRDPAERRRHADSVRRRHRRVRRSRTAARSTAT